MNTEIKGVHLEVTADIKDYISKKLQRLDFAQDHLIDLLFTLTQEKKENRIEVNMNFRWGNSNHVKASGYDIFKGIDLLFDKMELKIIKEKNKIQDHKGQPSVRTATTDEE